ncbi:TrfB-related DNA-binding protein [Pseudomonas putida]|uniref:TrfB-related DNA-binding protein n=1 Tax=Pseudomonas putida TaxID=303 RepID=UPI0026596719|nr:TrfB-related DNA-binding protein [Pseudomonas putida]MCZ9640996.1 transcriptional regulator KorA [Pseudomonas putida]
MQPMYTKEEWKKVAPLFASKRLAISTVEVAKAVLVDGQRITDVAEARGMTKQTAHAAVKRVRKILEEQGAGELVPVLVWLPPSWPNRFGKWPSHSPSLPPKNRSEESHGETKCRQMNSFSRLAGFTQFPFITSPWLLTRSMKTGKRLTWLSSTRESSTSCAPLIT